MRKIVALATVATGVIALAACTKPAENAAAPAADANAMAAPDAMNAGNAMDVNAMDSNAMGDNAAYANGTDANASNSVEGHTGSGGH